MPLQKKSKNITYYSWFYGLSGLIFPLPVWVLFFTRVITIEQLAVISALEAVITLVLEVPTGALADIIGRRKSILIGNFLHIAFFFSIPFASTFTEVLLLHIVSGLGSAMISGSDSALLYDSLKEEGREKDASPIYTKLGFYYRAGLITASIIGGWLYTMWYGLPYFARGLVIAVTSLCVYRMVEPGIDTEKFSWSRYMRQTREGLRELTRSGYLKKISAFYIIVGGITWSCLTYFNQPFALDFGFTAGQMSYITAGVYLAATLVLLYLTRNENILSRNRVYLAYPLLMLVSLLPGILVGRAAAIALMIGIQVAGSGRFAILDKYMNKEFSSRNRATALSTLNMGVSLMNASLIFLGGKVQGVYDTRLAYTLLGAVTVVLVLPLSLMLIREHNRYQKAGTDS